MRKLTLLFLLVGNLALVFGQANFEVKERERALKNKVMRQVQLSHDVENGKVATKGYVSKITSYDRNGNAIEIIEMEKSGSIARITNFSFDTRNNQTEFSSYKGNKEKLNYSLKRTFDANNNKKTEMEYNGSNYITKTFVYDASGKLSEIKYLTDNVLSEKRLFKNLGGKTEMSIVNIANTVTAKETTIFDGKNNVVEESKYLQDNETQKSNYSYDDAGKKLEEQQLKLGILVYKRKYTYIKNEITQIIEERSNIKPYLAYAYKYDENGNVTEEKWTKDPEIGYSRKAHTYDTRGLLVETNYFNASYNFSVVYKYNYNFFDK
jgi:hypothetical protein